MARRREPDRREDVDRLRQYRRRPTGAIAQRPKRDAQHAAAIPSATRPLAVSGEPSQPVAAKKVDKYESRRREEARGALERSIKEMKKPNSRRSNARSPKPGEAGDTTRIASLGAGLRSSSGDARGGDSKSGARSAARGVDDCSQITNDRSPSGSQHRRRVSARGHRRGGQAPYARRAPRARSPPVSLSSARTMVQEAYAMQAALGRRCRPSGLDRTPSSATRRRTP